MYYLKSIDGSKTRFDSLKAIFEKLEKESKNTYCYPLLKSDNCIVGESFEPRISLVNHWYEYKHNKAVQIFHKDDLVGFRNYPRHPYYPAGSKETGMLWLSCTNKYIVLDSFGRVVSLDYIIECYKQRYKAIHELKRNGRYWTAKRPNGVVNGYKSWKNQYKRLNAHYKPTFLSTELKVATSRDEYDLMYPLRTARKDVAKALNNYGECRYDDLIRSWKNQSKKRKQWM